MAYVPVAEQRRREALNKRPFKSEYFKLRYCPARARKELKRNPDNFAWRLSLKSDDTHWSYFRVKWAAQEQATRLDQLINKAIGKAQNESV